MNPIPQQDLETLVIDAVLGFYQPCLEKSGRENIVAIGAIQEVEELARELNLADAVVPQ